MSSNAFELDPTEDLVAMTFGEPGARQFFLQAKAGAQVLTLACEKAQVLNLVDRIRQVLAQEEPVESEPGAGREAGEAAAGAGSQPAEAASGPNPEPAEADAGPEPEPAWRIAELGLGFHESRKLYVIVAREDTADEEREGVVARLWLTADQLRAFANQADKVLSAGRPICSRCGLPIDPAGHPCPAANGSRPVF
jgi:uncharacterized repeat protein (TIGR03847 family)